MIERSVGRMKQIIFLNLIKERSKKFIKPTKYLLARKQTKRYSNFLATILASVIDKKELNEFGTEYLLKNKQLASDVLAVIEEVQFLLESYLKVDIKNLTLLTLLDCIQ